MWKKYLISFVIVLLLFIIPCGATDFDGQGILDELYETAPDEITSEMQDDQLTSESISKLLDWNNIINTLTSNLSDTLRDNMGMLASILGVLIIVAVYDALRGGFAASGTEKIADFFCAAAIALVICPPLMQRTNELKAVVCQLADYMKISSPIFTGLLVVSGNTGVAAVLNFFIYHASVFVGELFASVILPLIGTYISIALAAAISDNEGLKNISSSIRAITVKGMLIICSVFSVLLSLQGVIAGAGDTLSRRAMKLAVGSFLPITGNLMAESVDAFLSGVGIIRSVAGVFGIMVVFYLIIIPILKTLANFLLVKLSSFIGDLIGTTRVRALLGVVADGYGMLLSLSASVGVLFVICMAFLMVFGASG